MYKGDDNIKMDVTKIGCEGVDRIKLACDMIDGLSWT